MSTVSFAAIAVVSFGGPLALAALYGPQAVGDLRSGQGLAVVLAAAAFALPLWVWLRYSRDLAGPGGLYTFVRAAAGPRLALAQAAVWTVSYLLYLLYTTAYVVYDVLPAVSPRFTPYRSTMEVALPVALAAAVLAGRRVALLVLATIAASQLLLVLLLDVAAVRHGSAATSFAVPGRPAELGTAGADVALLFVCGSLPLFFGGEVDRPARTVRHVLPAVFGVTALAVTVAVLPLAVDPAFTGAAIPGMSLLAVDVGAVAATCLGVGVAVSVVGVMVVEYLALTRLASAVTGQPVRSVARWLAVPLVAAGPLSLFDPEAFYRALLKPSLVALWLSQLVVVAVYPLYVRRTGGRWPMHAAVAAGASAVMAYGLWNSLVGGGAT